MTAGHNIISPSFLRKEKERTLVALSFFRYFLFISLDFFSETYAMDREYCLPRILFFTLTNEERMNEDSRS